MNATYNIFEKIKPYRPVLLLKIQNISPVNWNNLFYSAFHDVKNLRQIESAYGLQQFDFTYLAVGIRESIRTQTRVHVYSVYTLCTIVAWCTGALVDIWKQDNEM